MKHMEYVPASFRSAIESSILGSFERGIERISSNPMERISFLICSNIVSVSRLVGAGLRLTPIILRAKRVSLNASWKQPRSRKFLDRL